MKHEPPRLHILPAREAAVAVVFRRKPSKRFDVLLWDTKAGEVTVGSRFRGKLYPLRSDVSFDGKWLVYLALGSSGTTWNGVCQLPWLKTTLEAPNTGTWFGGGYWASRKELRLNNWVPAQPAALPFRTTTYTPAHGEDEGVLYARLERDGWRRNGPFGEMQEIKNRKKLMVECIDDPGWSHQFSRRHPVLTLRYLGYLTHGRTFRFELSGFPDLLDARVQWACWDAEGGLLVARAGAIARYSLTDLDRGKPSFFMALETELSRPAV